MAVSQPDSARLSVWSVEARAISASCGLDDALANCMHQRGKPVAFARNDASARGCLEAGAGSFADQAGAAIPHGKHTAAAGRGGIGLASALALTHIAGAKLPGALHEV